MRLTMAPYCAAIRPAAWVPAMPSACTTLSAGRRSAAAAPATPANTPTVAPECQPWPMCCGPMHSVELEALHECAVGKRRVRRAEPLLAAPHAALGRGIDARKRRHQDAAPFETGAEQRAAERVEHEQFQPLDHLARDALVGEAGDEVGDAARVRIVPGRSAHEA